MSILDFKTEIEKTLLITKWSPSERDLVEIAIRIRKANGDISKSDIRKIVIDIVGSYDALIMEGADNTDLTTLLYMATKTAKNDD
ncbi:hypothetical protein AXN64_21105 [Salmonella enterica subsp. enterica]|nr:hypothetical protein [Salmonella enterica subsp. enterica]ECI1498584.1 hypothetical protein [Salmonella enterica subsp. enterica serovar Kentucky]EDE2633014.1 hypothetical protein [Salmonella enterica subsp. enterica serovar Blijdorp]EDT5584224.1 hypothetical protein [Salmonella enterica subsp. enterica serovar Choleraesuis]HAF4750577.1 hypothetical protein [Salmonella enterica]